MGKEIGDLFLKFKNTPFPELGKVVGDFALYDSLLAGAVSSFLAGRKIAVDAIPIQDPETQETLAALKSKRKPTKSETDFIQYARLLEGLQTELVRDAKSLGGR